MPSEKQNFYSLIREAIADFTEHGFDTQARLHNWLKKLAAAARSALVPEYVLERTMRSELHRVFKRMVEGAGLKRAHRGIDKYTLAAIKPRLRSELDRRILASADLIRFNREASINSTLQRFAGWATSISIGGSPGVSKTEAARNIRKAVTRLPYEERRVIIDQGHKLVASIDEIVAEDGGAIAGVWHSRWREAGYDYREEHKDRDNVIYVVRGNWALRKGLMKLAGAEYTDQITAPGEEPFCRCRFEYYYTLRDLPEEMLTRAGVQALAEARQRIGMRRLGVQA